MPGVLEGIRVLDFGRYIAGPFCGTMLGDLGAEVIRIEKLDGSEDRWVTPVVEGGEGAMFLQMGRNKLGLTLNPMKPAGREIVKKLVAQSDIVIANLPYETCRKMGIDYDTISAINPRIILATTSTFGSEGPYATRVGFDTIGQAMSGAMFLSGDGKVPTRMNAPFVDFGTALLNTVGVLAALIERAQERQGPEGRDGAPAHRHEHHQRPPDRAGDAQPQPHRHAQPRLHRRALRHLQVQRRLDLRHDHRPAAVRALVQADGRREPGQGSALQGRPGARRQWRGSVGNHAELVQHADREGGARGAGGEPHSGRRRSTRRSRRWTIPTSSTPNSSTAWTIPAPPSRCRSCRSR